MFRVRQPKPNAGLRCALSGLYNVKIQPMSSLDKSPQKIRTMFDSIAPWYDFLNHFLSLGIDVYWRKATAKRLLNTDTVSGDVLDVCCGTGDLTAALRRVYLRVHKGVTKNAAAEQRRFYGIDFSEAMVKRAQQKLSCREPVDESTTLPCFAVGDALHLPFDDERFALIAVAFGLRNVADTEQGLAEMIRVCRPGGTVGVLEFSMPTFPMIASLYRFYFRKVLPLVGRFFSGNRDGAYRYLPESVLEFDEPALLRQRMERLGLSDVQSYPMTFGIATLTLGRLKPVPA